MTNEQAKKMLKAKLECFKNETSGINHDCNMRLCDGCSLNYEQGNMGEQKEALKTAIKALEQTSWIPCDKELPEIGQDILFCDIDGDIYVGHRTKYYWWSVDDKVKCVIAWMPLPKPYEESEDKE